MKIALNVTGIEELARALNALPTAVRRRALYKVLRTAAEPMRSRAAELAPIDPTTPRDLKENIGISATTRIGSTAGGRWDPADDRQAAVAVGPTKGYYYGLFLEYGTVRMSAQPFMRPAFDYAAPRSLGLLRDGFWELIEAEAHRQGPFRP